MSDIQHRKRTQVSSALSFTEQIQQYLMYGEFGQVDVSYADTGDMERVIQGLREVHSLLAERSAMRGSRVS